MKSAISKSMRSYANQNVEGSISETFRKKRMKLFEKFCEKIGRNLKVVDIGGTYYHWKSSAELLESIELTLVNIEKETDELPDKVKFIQADARSLEFMYDKQFDVAYSNSVIEHFSDFEEQMKVASNIRRIANHYFVQTPNYYFPVEPHFLFPFFQMLPEGMKKTLVKNFSLGWYEKQADENSASELVKSIRLLKRKELIELFPDAEIHEEKFFGMNKSFIAYH
ncbi:MAG: methyltransferase domain-containing protein [Ignavibacteria bacterium]|nr:methyltransferase domain-containing protein [Ignavibacteria bacterium]